MSIKFAIMGSAGYVAPRHMEAIKSVGGELVAVLDPHDSVGILDNYSKDCLYFRDPERFDRWLSKNHVDYVSVCSPNYLHDSHCLMAMRNGANVICEKPVVLNERNLDNLLEWEQKTGRKINVVLQCRLHESSVKAKSIIKDFKTYSASVNYVTPRGKWYDYSWKMDISKSGGLPTNIGIHLFDLCVWLFGEGKSVKYRLWERVAFGEVCFNNAIVKWKLSIENKLPQRVFDILEINGEVFSIDLTKGFTSLHNLLYKEVLGGSGFTLEDARPSIRIVERMRDAKHI